MTNEEKALNLSGLKETPDYEERYYNSTYCLVYDKCLEMAMWKDEQFKAEKQALMDKAYEWLEPVFKDLCGYYSGAELFDDFKKAMEE